jgi:hypothetical protein
MMEFPQAQYLVNYGELQSSGTLLEIQSVVPVIWYGCKQYLALVGVRVEDYTKKIIGRKKTTELHH